jgi:hypothetical protein
MIIEINEWINVDLDRREVIILKNIDVVEIYSTLKKEWHLNKELARIHFPLNLEYDDIDRGSGVPFQKVELKTIFGWNFLIQNNATILPLRVDTMYTLGS